MENTASINTSSGGINSTNYEFNPSDTLNITTNSTFILTEKRELRDSKFIQNEEGNFIEITYEITNPYLYGTTAINFSYTQTPTKSIVKERYGVFDNKLQLLKTIKGQEKPGYYVESTIEWEE